jgi:hypothetical protein
MQAYSTKSYGSRFRHQGVRERAKIQSAFHSLLRLVLPIQAHDAGFTTKIVPQQEQFLSGCS